MWAIKLARVVFLGLFAACTLAAEPPSDVRILVDISGSMKQSDPKNLRIPAVNLLLELLPNGSQAGIWTFGRQVNRLVPPAKVDAKWRAEAKAKARSINSVGLFTNLTDVLQNAASQISPTSGFKHSVILLTDGRIDMREPGTPSNIDEQERKRLLQQVLPAYVRAGARIHTVALSDNVDKELMQQLSAATGGLFLEARSAEDLMKVFVKAFDRAVPVEQVPLVGNSFKIDAAVKEFTALVYRKSNSPKTKLIAPSGKIFAQEKSLNNLHWYQDIGFDLITVDQPEVGEWLIEADMDPDNRVQVLTDLKLKATGIAPTLFLGAPLKLEAMLTNHDEVVNNADLLRNTVFTLTIKAPDGRVGSKVISQSEQIPVSGIYREDLSKLSLPGEYRIEVSATGKTFTRQQVLTASLLEPLKVQGQPLNAEETFLVVVQPDASVDAALSHINASIKAPNGVTQMQHLQFNEDSKYWELRLKADLGPGSYHIALNIRGVLYGGADFQFQPKELSVTFPLGLARAAPGSAAAPAPAAEFSTEEAHKPKLQVPDLAAEYAKQQEALAPKAEPAPAEIAVAPEEEGVPWWLYIAIAGGCLVVIGGGAFWLLRGKAKKQTKEPAKAATEAEAPVARAVPEDLIQQDIDTSTPVPEVDNSDAALDQELSNSLESMSGDFDSFSGESEIEIPIPNAAGEAGSERLAALDDDFAIDPEQKNSLSKS
ncbi:MAG: hypothetical protein RL217_269 [Pseudomonadota bacterium]|jgi:uncharacterized protein (TIGR03503 family)